MTQDPDIAQLRKEYITGYDKVNITDTTFITDNGKEVRVYSKYYCLFDSGLNVPGRFVWEDTNATFISHNFANDVVVAIDGDTIFTKTIEKKDFDQLIPHEWELYSVLMSPNINYIKTSNTVKLSYSISIPVTDLGIGLSMEVNKKGNFSYGTNE